MLLLLCCCCTDVSRPKRLRAGYGETCACCHSYVMALQASTALTAVTPPPVNIRAETHQCCPCDQSPACIQHAISIRLEALVP